MEGGQDVSFGRSNGIGIGCEKERRGGRAISHRVTRHGISVRVNRG